MSLWRTFHIQTIRACGAQCLRPWYLQLTYIHIQARYIHCLELPSTDITYFSHVKYSVIPKATYDFRFIDQSNGFSGPSYRKSDSATSHLIASAFGNFCKSFSHPFNHRFCLPNYYDMTTQTTLQSTASLRYSLAPLDHSCIGLCRLGR